MTGAGGSGGGSGGGHGGGSGGDGGGGERNLANSAVAAALRYRAQAPIVDGLMKELGFDGGSLDSLVAAAVAPAAVAPHKPAAPLAAPEAETPSLDLAAE